MASYYVDATGGMDSNPGTEVQPWKTLAHVNAQTFSPGDTIYLKCGETWEELLNPGQSGTSGNYIHFTKYGSGALPVIRAANGRPEAVTLVTGRSYIKLSFLKLVGGDSVSASGLLESASITNVAEDMEFDGEGVADNCAAGSITLRRFYITGGRDDGFTMHGTDEALLENGEITGCTDGINNSGSAMNLTVNEVYIHNNSDDEIGPLSETIGVFNRCKIKTSATSRLFNGATSPSTFNACIFDASAGTPTSAEFNTSGITNANNCTFYGGGNGKIGVDGAALTLTNCILADWNIAANLFNGGTFNKNYCLTSNVSSGSISSNTNAVVGSPDFTNPSGGDFTLQEGSAAIDAGVNLGLQYDFAGNLFSNPPSVGAYEFATAILNITTLNATTLTVG